MRQKILNKIAEEKLSYDKIAIMAKLHRNTVRNYILCLTRPLCDTEERIAKALGVWE